MKMADVKITIEINDVAAIDIKRTLNFFDYKIVINNILHNS